MPRTTAAFALALSALVSAAPARAAEDIVIGAIYPLTGSASQIGADARAAIDTELEIINGRHLSMDNSSPSLNQRGLKWFFRTSPHDEMFTAAMFDFFKEVGAKTGHPVKSVSLFYEDSIFGSDSSAVQRQLAAAAGITVAADILRSLSEVGYKPGAIMAQAAGFAEQSFLTAAGPLADGVFSRSSFAIDATKSRPAITPVNAMYKAKSGKDLNDNTSRQVVAVQTLADAINRSGTGKPDDIRKALMATDIPGDQTIMPWKGVKFDATGQNIEATPVIQQVFNGSYFTVYPASVATKEPVWNVGK